MANFGFLRTSERSVADVLEARSHEIPALIYVHPADTVRDAVEAMRRHGVSQLPVAKGEMPIAAAEVMGAVSELSLMHHMSRDPDALDRPVEQLMSPPLPTVGIGQPVQLVVDMLETASAVLVLAGGRPEAVLSRSDVLGLLSPVAPGGDR
jgi:cystathionine beta-synthase